ncbi:MAG: DUF1028 domain-containing protein [Gemmatimonadetes bacterium]|nr:DUF1028 domain-containing protein [Gemmatimonadota bacterium]
MEGAKMSARIGWICLGAALTLAGARPAAAQEPAGWGTGPDIEFTTFSIAAVDLETGESGVAGTTRNPCVGNGVPWVRKGVGAVATQASTRTEYGNELFDLMEKGLSPQAALDQLLANDPMKESRQIGVIGVDGRTAQWGGASNNDHKGLYHGAHYVVQGNSLHSAEVLPAVARTFESTEGSHRWLADRLIEALNAGHEKGGDGRHGEYQSAVVITADPRPNMARRADGQTVFINVCENANPLAEMRRIYNTISERIGFRELQQQTGNDVGELKAMLHELGYLPADPATENERRNVYTQDAVEAVDKFKTAQGWKTSVPGFVDAEVIDRLWSELEKAGKAEALRRRFHDAERINR